MINNIKHQIIDFRFASVNDILDSKYVWGGTWSRLYEYKYVIDFIEKNKLINIPEIHNSSWGYEGIHLVFRDDLDKIGNCVHSDIVNSKHRKTFYYDITTELKEFENKFDFVVNISTIEHLSSEKDQIKSIENLFKQVKCGGYLILTFDYPRVNLNIIETLTNVKCAEKINVLNGENSANPNKSYKDLNIVYLIIKKNE